MKPDKEKKTAEEAQSGEALPEDALSAASGGVIIDCDPYILNDDSYDPGAGAYIPGGGKSVSPVQKTGAADQSDHFPHI